MTPLKEKRRLEIFQGAIKVFNRDGFHKGTVEEIAKEAGLGKGTIYEYFNSKQQLFEEMILFILSNYKEELIDSISEIERTEEKLLVLLDFNKEFLEDYGSIMESSMYLADSFSKEIKPVIGKLHNSIYSLVLELVKEAKEKGEIREGLNEDLVALIWINIIGGLNREKNIFNSKIEIDNEEVVEILFKGIN